MNSLGKINGLEVFEENGRYFEGPDGIRRIDPLEGYEEEEFFERYDI